MTPDPPDLEWWQVVMIVVLLVVLFIQSMPRPPGPTDIG